ncbi:MAG: hypothetical protein ACYSTF_01295 [Planctomycetota bacterium]|jgi:hypothetical protein
MADNDSNIIKPVESLHNIAGLTPANRREERRRRQNLPEQENDEFEQQSDEPIDEQDVSDFDKNGDEKNTIDYCA